MSWELPGDPTDSGGIIKQFQAARGVPGTGQGQGRKHASKTEISARMSLLAVWGQIRRLYRRKEGAVGAGGRSHRTVRFHLETELLLSALTPERSGSEIIRVLGSQTFAGSIPCLCEGT